MRALDRLLQLHLVAKSTRFLADRAVATALAKETWPASSMNRKSSWSFHSGRLKSHAVPAMIPAEYSARAAPVSFT